MRSKADEATANLLPYQVDLLWRKIDRRGDDECWPWMGSLQLNGYPCWTVYVGGGHVSRTATIRPYRAVWHLTRGPIPEGLTIDHPCRAKTCCNPNHLEPVTARVNSQRRPTPPKVESHGASIQERQRVGRIAWAVLMRHDGKQTSRTFDTREDAERFAGQVRTEGVTVAAAAMPPSGRRPPARLRHPPR